MQGFNMGRYVPPDVEGTISANKHQRKHALGARASKISQGILTVRFEMPYAIWCSTCPKPTIIGQGVRFNAEKKKVGVYYTSPIWSFRFRHLACGGTIEIRTDPKNTAYVVHEGATKRDTGEDVAREGDTVILTDQERETLRKNAFASLEKTISDRQALKDATDRIDGLLNASDRHWSDTYSQNQKLRKTFRAERKTLETASAKADALRDKMSLGIDLLPETEADALRAALVDFRPVEDNEDVAATKALAKPLFESTKKPSTQSSSSDQPKKRLLKGEAEATRRKDALVSSIIGNTLASQDPFLQSQPRTSKRLLGVKRKQSTSDKQVGNTQHTNDATHTSKKHASNAAPLAGLVEYDSD
ncbi:hypothetical protein Golomagni_06385, partial [Golovinomyces magnicellulatus]